MLKPDVVFFGEFIPAEKFREAEQLVQRSDALVIAGSSLVVNSGIRLLERARRRRLPVVIVNRGATRADARATVKIDAGTSDVLRALADALPRRVSRAGRWPRSRRLGSTSDAADPRPPRRDRLEPRLGASRARPTSR